MSITEFTFVGLPPKKYDDAIYNINKLKRLVKEVEEIEKWMIENVLEGHNAEYSTKYERQNECRERINEIIKEL